MAVRKLHNWWYVDLRHERKRRRIKSPENSRAGAQAYELVLRNRLARGELLIPKSTNDDEATPTFAEFAKEWFETYVKANNKPSEQAAKRSILQRHLIPSFGQRHLCQISTASIEQFKARKRCEGLSAKRINNVLTVLNTCLKTAVEWDLLKVSPRVKLLKIAPTQITFLEQDELNCLLSNRRDQEWHAMITVAARTGMRLGELVTLMWQDVDFRRNLITVRRSLSADQIAETKNYRIRHIPMTTVGSWRPSQYEGESSECAPPASRPRRLNASST